MRVVPWAGRAFARSGECFAGLGEWLASEMRRGYNPAGWRNGWRCGAGSCCGGCSRTGWT